MAVGEIVIKLELDDKNFKGSISGASGDIRRFERAVKSVDDSVGRAEQQQRSWGRTLRDSVIVLGLARHALENLNTLVLGFPRAVLNANAELERMAALMAGLSTEAGGMAAAQLDAQKSVDYLFDTAKRAPFEIGALTDAFVKLKAVGLDPMGGTFQGLVDSVAKFGGTPENLKRAAIAIQQMAGKGVISMEELRQQLGESVPDAMQLMARSMGVTMGELVEKVSTGTVEAKNALAAMARQMNIENAGAALAMSETWSGMINRMKTSMVEAAKVIGDAGFFDEAKGQLSSLVNGALTDPRFFNAMRQLGEGMGVMVEKAGDAAGALYDLSGHFGTAAKSLLAFYAVMKVRKHWDTIASAASRAGSAFSVWDRNLAKAQMAMLGIRNEVEAANRANKKYDTGIRQQSVALAQVGYAARGATTALKGLFAAMGGWTTVLTFGIPAAIAAVSELRDKTLEAAEDIDLNRPDLITEDQLAGLRQAVVNLEDLKRQREELRQQEKTLNGSGGTDFSAGSSADAFLARLDQQKREEYLQDGIAQGRSIAELNRTIAAAEQSMFERTIQAFERQASLAARGGLREAVSRYKANLNELISSDLGEEELRQARLQEEERLRQAVAGQYDQQIADQRQAIATLRSEKKEGFEKEVELRQKYIEELERLKTEGLEVFDGTIYQMEFLDKKDADKELSALDQFLTSRNKMFAKYNAEVANQNPYLAEFEALVEMGRFADSTEAQLDAARQTMTELWQARQQATEVRDNERAFEDHLERIGQLTDRVNTKFAQRENDNPWMQDAIAADKLRQTIAGVRGEIEGLTVHDAERQKAAIEQLDELMTRTANNARTATTNQMEATAESIEASLLPPMERIEAEYDRLIDQAWEWKAAQDQLTPEQLEQFYRYLQAVNDKAAHDTRTPLMQLMDEWEDSTTQMERMWANTMSSFVDTLTDGFMEGKLEMSDFVEEFGRMIIKIQMQKMAAGIVSSIGSLLPGGGMQYNAATYTGAYGFANGGIMTDKGALPLKMYANGGIATSPQVAVFGEGRMNEAYVPLPDGRTIPVTMKTEGQGGAGAPPVTVNLFNESGQAVEADAGRPRFDGRQYVLDVVLSGLNRPGAFRSGVKSALNK